MIFEVGNIKFKSKKEATLYYQNILHKYEIGSELNKDDFNKILDLLNLHPEKNKKIGVGIKKIKISLINKFNTRAFQLIRTDNSTEIFSFHKIINSKKSNFTKFSEACRAIIQKDLWHVKVDYFKRNSKKGLAKCQETGELLSFENLSVEHRPPNTFSAIVDRFIELNSIDLKNIEYIEKDGAPNELKDKKLIEKFREYHKEKANLRVIKKELNLKRSYQGKIKRQDKDLKIR